MALTSSVLLACSDAESRNALRTFLVSPGVAIQEAKDVIEAEVHLSSAVSLVLCEDCLPKGGYRELLRKIQLARLEVPLVVSSATGGTEQYLEAMQLGADDYIIPPYRRELVESIVQRRHQARHPLILPVQVYGVDAAGVPFLGNGSTRNVSARGARLAGIRVTLRPGDLIGVNCCEKTATCRVAWIGEVGEFGAGREIGVESLDPAQCGWNFGSDPNCKTPISAAEAAASMEPTLDQ